MAAAPPATMALNMGRWDKKARQPSDTGDSYDHRRQGRRRHQDPVVKLSVTACGRKGGRRAVFEIA